MLFKKIGVAATIFLFIVANASAQHKPADKKTTPKSGKFPSNLTLRANSGNITPGDTSFCQGGSVTYTAPGNAPYQWLLNGNQIPGAITKTYLVAASGVYTVISAGDTSLPVTVTVKSKPIANFSFSPNNQCSNVPVFFSNNSTGTGLTYSWSFGDPNSGTSNTSTDINPNHEFVGTPGVGNQSFNVELTATGNGCSSTQSASVTNKQLPGTQLNGTGATIFLDKPYFSECDITSSLFTFQNVSSTTLSNVSYRIVWGDNTPDFVSTSFSSTMHNYNIGTYTLQFIVTGANCTDTGTYYVFRGSNPTGSISSPGSTVGCTGETFSFPFANISNNPPGTQYLVYVNDGSSDTIRYTQENVPANFVHTFNNGSCGSSPNNTFTVSFLFRNPCGETPGTIGGIRISKKASANFSVSPKDTVCVNAPVTLTNTGSAGLTVPPTGSGACTPGKIVWQITPATGWSISSGSLGSDFGTSDVDLWLSGTNSIQLNFTVAATYTIKFKTGTNRCGLDSITKTICVNPQPTGSFTIDQTNGCGPLIVNTTTSDNTPFCGLNTYQWSVSYASTTSCEPNTIGYSLIGGTTLTSKQPKFQFNNPGVYTIGVTIFSPGRSCSTVISSQQVIVRGKPTVNLSAPASACQNSSVTTTANVNCNISGSTTYNWTFSGATPSTSTSAIPGSITFNGAGNQTISLAVTNECGTTSATRPIFINPRPDIITPANINFCPGVTAGPFNFAGSLGGTTYSWTNSNTAIGLGASGTGSTVPSFTTTNTGTTAVTATITLNVNNGGCVNSSSFIITVNPKPAVPAAPNVTYCKDAVAVPLTATASNGHTLLWYTVAIGGTGSATAPTPATSGAGTFTYWVLQANSSTTCESNRTAFTVTVNPIPAIASAIATNPTSCNTNTGFITLNGLNANAGYTASYVKNGATVTGTFTANGTGNIVINGLGAGTYSNIVVTLSGNTCPSNPAGPVSLSDPDPPNTPTATATTPVCSGQTIQLNASSTTPGVTYQWSGPNAFTSTTQNPIVTNATTLATGTYSVSVKLAACKSPAATVDVVVNATPVTPTVSGNSPICSGSLLTLNASSSTAGVSYSWTGPNSFSSNISNPTIPNATSAASGTYSVTAATVTCTSTAGTVSVTVKPTPVLGGSSSTNPSTCNTSTGSITLIGLSNSTLHNITYTKDGTAQSANATSNATGTLIITALAAGVYNNIVVSLNGCPSAPVGPFTLSDPNPPATPTATSSSPVCSGGTLNLFANTTSIGTITYTWSGPGGYTTTVQNPSITNVATTASGTYSVTAKLNGCTSAAGSVSVVINPTPAAPTTASNSPLCTGNSINITSSVTFAGSVSYTWTGPNGFNSTNQNPTISNAASTGAGTYQVIATAITGNCASPAKTVTVVVNPTPNISSAVANNPASCASATGSIVLNGLAVNTTYTVTYTKSGSNVTANLIANGSGVITINGLTAAVYDDIKVTRLGCASNLVGPFTLADPTPPATPVATSNSPICSGNTLNLSATSSTGGTITYTWSGPNNFTSSVQNPVILNATTAASGTYSVTATINGCTSAAATNTAIVNATPNAPTVSSNSPVCTGNTLNLSSTTNFTGSVTYAWSGPNSFTSTSQSPSIPSVTIAGAGSYSLIITATTGSCPSLAASTVVVVNPTPAITASSKTDPSNCNTATGSITLQGVAANTSYVVSYSKNGTSQTATITSNSSGNVIIGSLTSATYDNISVTASGCASNTVGPFTLVDPNPPAAPVATSNGPICSGSNLSLNAASTSTGTLTFAWSGPGIFTSSSQNAVISNATTSNTGTYSVTVTLNNCTSAAVTVAVIVDQTPATPIPSGNGPVCTGNTLNLNAATTFTGPVTWSWTGPNSFSSTQQSPSVSGVTSAANGTYNVVATAITGNCPSAVSSILVVVNPTPNISTGSGSNPTNCNTATGSITLAGLYANTAYTVNYQQNSIPKTASLTANSSGVLVIPTLPAGVYTNITVTLTGCTSNVAGPFTLVDPNPPVAPVANSNSPLCGGSTLNLSATSSTTGNLLYTWSGPNGFTSTSQNPSIPNVTTAASGTYFVTATLNSCVSPTETVAVVINPTPAAPVPGSNSPICAGSTLNLTSTTTFNGNLLYAWTGPNSFSGNVQNPAINNATTAATGTYTLVITATVGSCPSAPASVAVTVSPELVNTIDTDAKTICFSQPVTITGTVATGGNGSFAYQWEQSTDGITWTAIMAQTGQSITITPTTSIYLRRRVTSLPCQSFSLPVFVTVQPPITNNSIQKNQAICNNTQAATLIGSTPVGANGIYIYAWEKSTNGGLTWTAIGGAASKDFVPGVLTITTQYRRLVTSNLCSGPQSNTSAVVTITVNPDALAKWIVIRDTSCSPFIINNSALTPQLQPTRNLTYNWYANDVFYGTSATGNPGYTLVQPGDSVKIKMVAVSLYGCRNDSLEHWFFTPPRPQPAFAASDTVKCGPAAITFTNLTPRLLSFKYKWNFGNGQTSVLPNPGAITYQPNPNYGDTIYRVSLVVYSQCDTLTIYKNILIKSKPKALYTPSKTNGCSPMTVQFINASKGINANYVWLFGDGTQQAINTAASVQHTYNTAVQDTFYAKLVTINECGSDTQTYLIVVAPNKVKLNVAINGNQVYGCKPQDVMFINNSAGATNFGWEFGDGNTRNTTMNVDTIRHTYNQTGTFTVKVFASNGCSDTSTTLTITVFAKPVVDFAYLPSPICIGDSIHFKNQSDTTTSVLWKFGDGNTSSLSNPHYKYATAGRYTVTLVGVRQYATGNACLDSTKKTVTVLSSLPGRFTVGDSVSSCVPFTVTFTNQTYPSVLTTWDFGDGKPDTGNIVMHTFIRIGTYQVTMIANTTGGCKYVMTKPVIVNGPAGTFTYDNGGICGSAPVRFQVNATGIDSIRYHFGDGVSITSTNTTVYHTYKQGGNYIPTATLLAGVNGSCKVALIGIDSIKVDVVKAGFREATTKECGKTTVIFTDTSRAYAGLVQWAWNFGNGNTSTFQNPQQVFTSTNNWQVQLIINSKSGCADTITKTNFVKVNNKPVSAIVADSVGCTNQPVNYTGIIISQDAISNYQWTFGNGAVGYRLSFTNNYAAAGSYNAALITTTLYGCSDSSQKRITIYPSPIVKASDDKQICRGQSVQLRVTGSPVYSWGPFYGLGCYTCANPVANPTNTTVYEVTGTNSFGCASKDTVNIRVVQPFAINVKGKDTICIGQSTQLIASGATRYVWTPFTGLNFNNIATPVATPVLTTAYRIVGYDAENCFTDTARITVAVGEYPTIALGADKTLATGTQLSLQSVITNGPITRWLWTPATDLSCSTCPLPVATVKKEISYRVAATNLYKCTGYDTLTIKVFCESTQVFIPNLFTPDGDGLNDVLMVRGTGIKTIKNFRIFNRWGELVFEKSNFGPNEPRFGWDGMVRGQKAPPDVYVYTCEVLCDNDIPFVYKGNTAIIK